MFLPSWYSNNALEEYYIWEDGKPIIIKLTRIKFQPKHYSLNEINNSNCQYNTIYRKKNWKINQTIQKPTYVTAIGSLWLYWEYTIKWKCTLNKWKNKYQKIHIKVIVNLRIICFYSNLSFITELQIFSLPEPPRDYYLPNLSPPPFGSYILSFKQTAFLSNSLCNLSQINVGYFSYSFRQSGSGSNVINQFCFYNNYPNS